MSAPGSGSPPSRPDGGGLHLGLYEAHLPVTELGRSVHFYGRLGFELAYGARDDPSALLTCRAGGQRWMLGLFEVGDIVHRHPAEYHLAFRADPDDVDTLVSRLETRGIQPTHPPTAPEQGRMSEPIVHGWMPAAAVFFRDPDDHLLELVAELDEPPRPDFVYRPLSEWREGR